MPLTLQEMRLFWGEFRRTYQSTGAVMPSGKSLTRALARYVATPSGASDPPRRILEVGPGTGAATRQIARVMGPHDTLHLVELNERFVDHLRGRIQAEPCFQALGDRVSITQAPVQEVDGAETYDAIVSGLPLNNFSVTLVEEIVEKLRSLLAPGGTLSFFEYIAIRRAKALVSKRDERERLQRIASLLDQLLSQHSIHRDRVLVNVPPAWVHHVRFESNVT